MPKVAVNELKSGLFLHAKAFICVHPWQRCHFSAVSLHYCVHVLPQLYNKQ